MSTDATQVTGSSSGSGAPRPGDVLAERYELLEVVDSEGPVVSYRALDQESERPVLVRVLVGEALPDAEHEAIVSRLRGLVGVGGRYLGSLLDADHERGNPFTVEAWPRGTQLSAIVAARRGRGEALGAQETLPVVAQLASALSALPESLCHGDVRAERVWLDTDGLRLTGAHLLSALPRATLAARMIDLGPGALAYAPEMMTGEASLASDRWGVASIAWEALTGRSPDPEAESPEVKGALREALVALLAEEPSERPDDLDALVAALAAEANLAVPRLDPEAFRPPTARIPSDAAAAPGAPRPRVIEGAAEEGTQEIAFDQIIEEKPLSATKPERGEISVDSLDPRLVRAALGVSLDSDEIEADDAGDTAKHDALSVEEAVIAAASKGRGPDSLDPRLVRAALDVQLDSDESGETAGGAASGREPSIDGLDPRLVRAALGVTLEDSSETSIEELVSGLEELDEDLLEAEDTGQAEMPPEPAAAPSKPPAKAVPARPPGAAKPKAPPRPFPGPKPLGSAPPPGKLPGAGPPKAPKPGGPKAPPPGPSRRAPKAPAPRASEPAKPAAKSAPKAPKPAAPAAVASRAPKPAPPKSPAPASSGPPPSASPSPPSPAPGPSVSSPAPASSPKPGHAVPLPSLDHSREPGPTQSKAAASRPTPTPSRAPSRAAGSRSIAGIVIVLVALIVAVAIIGVGFLIASHRRSEAARQRQLEQRWEQIQQER